MDSLEALEIVNTLGIPKTTLARLAGTHDAIVYNFLDGKSVSSLSKHKVVTAIQELQRWIPTLGFAPSFKDWRAVQNALFTYRMKHLREVGVEKVREEYQSPDLEESSKPLKGTAGLGSKK